jgi:hypothetical protein
MGYLVVRPSKSNSNLIVHTVGLEWSSLAAWVPKVQSHFSLSISPFVLVLSVRFLFLVRGGIQNGVYVGSQSMCALEA